MNKAELLRFRRRFKRFRSRPKTPNFLPYIYVIYGNIENYFKIMNFRKRLYETFKK